MCSCRFLLVVLFAFISLVPVSSQTLNDTPDDDSDCVKSVLFIGDSMTGWLAERLNAYGEINGFKVMAEIWDGSTIRKWGADPLLSQSVARHKPDVIFISLGLNELFETNPEKRLRTSMDRLKGAIGDIPVIWIGPLSWPGKAIGANLNQWLSDEMGEGHFFNSFTLDVPRQSKSNPHPTREATIEWMDTVMEWLKTDGAITLPGYTSPGKKKVSRPKVFNYRRMNR